MRSGRVTVTWAAVLILAHRDGLPQRQRVRVHQRPGGRDRVGQRIAAQHDHAGVAGAGRVADHPHLPDREEGGDAFGLGLQIGHLPAGRHPDPELLPGPGQPTAGDPRHPIIHGGQLGMAAGQRPPPPQMRPEQRMGERLPGPGNHRHHEGGGHDQPLRTRPAQPVAQPHIGSGHDQD